MQVSNFKQLLEVVFAISRIIKVKYALVIQKRVKEFNV